MAASESEACVYILSCADGSLYTGATTALEKRLEKHQLGKASRYTRSRLPVVLVYRESCPGYAAALRREAEIKKMPRSQKERLLSP